MVKCPIFAGRPCFLCYYAILDNYGTTSIPSLASLMFDDLIGTKGHLPHSNDAVKYIESSIPAEILNVWGGIKG
jgi:hypothetical protein